jgi:hypothetical protein
MVHVQMAMWWWSGLLQLGWGGVAGDQPNALDPGGQAVTAQHPPHPIGRQDDAAPLGTGGLGRDPGRPGPWVAVPAAVGPDAG